jgi:hypothetical protein
MEVNMVDARDPQIWEAVLGWAIQRLQLIEQGGPTPEKIVTPQVKPEDANPYRYDDSPRSAYAMRERQRANDQLWAEQAAPVRAWLLSPEKRFGVSFSIYGELRCTQILVGRHSRQIAFACCRRHSEITCTGAS